MVQNRKVPHRLGERLKKLRQERRWTLGEAGQHTGVAASTLSKIENDRMSPTFDVVQKLATGFDVSVIEFFANNTGLQASGRRSLTLAGTGRSIETQVYANQLLASDLVHKKIVPVLTRVKARSLEDFDELSSHDGEEFMFVLEGAVFFHTELYEPVHMQEGDSVYIDSGMQHACYSVSKEDALVLWMYTG